MRFRVLGRVVADNEQGQISLGSARQRAVLAALLIEPGTPVAIDQLVDRVWGPAPPQRARETLHTYLSRLRSMLREAGGPSLVRRSGSYALEVDESAVDLFQFRALAAQARQAVSDHHAAPLWRAAMALWQDTPFADVEGDWFRAVAVSLEAERLAAMLDHTDVLLRCGEHARLLPELAAAADRHPLDERAARYRSQLAGRRMLIVLDNAASEAQVRPLLPGSGSCLVVVTSRDSLAGLVAVHGAHRLDLDLLTAGEAVSLLRRLIGPRVEAEPEAAATLAEQCVRLPLALRIAAELAVSRPDSPLADLTAELADRQARLELLNPGGDPFAAVREVFSWSIQQLPGDAARTSRLLGLHPGPDVDPYAAAALADTDLDEARRVLGQLARAHLLHRTGRGRYGIHDLLRAYAAHLATVEATEQQREAAQQRLLDYYQATAVSAMDTLHPAEAHHRPEPAASTTPIPDLTAPEAAHAWLRAERFCLVAVAAHGATTGRSDYVVGLSRILHRYLGDAHLPELVAINDHAFRAAEQAGDLAGQAHALRALGMAYNRLSQYEVALEHFRQALTRFRQAGDLVGEALALTSLGITGYRLGDHKQAVDDHLQGIDLARRAGDRLGEGFGLNNLAVVEERVGRYAEAAEHHQQALVIFRELGARYCEGLSLSNLANVELRQGQYACAAERLWQSLAMLQQFDSTITVAHTLDTLGILHLHRGEPEPATEYFQQALGNYRRTSERSGQAWSINGLGEAAQLAGQPAQALTHHTDALAMAEATGVRHQQARAHTGIGHARRALGQLGQAWFHYERAHVIYTELDMPDADDIRGYLALLAPAPGNGSGARPG